MIFRHTSTQCDDHAGGIVEELVPVHVYRLSALGCFPALSCSQMMLAQGDIAELGKAKK